MEFYEIVAVCVVLIQSLVSFPRIKRQVLVCQPAVKSPKEFTEGTTFGINQEFGLV